MQHEKQAVLGAAVSAIAQNAIGIPIARSKKFKSSLARAAVQGAAGRKAPRNLKSLASDAIHGVAAPEVNAARNQAYSAGASAAKKLHLHKATKRELVVARLAAAGDEKGLKRIGQHKSPLAAKVRAAKTSAGLPNIPKSSVRGHVKELRKLEKGYRVPSSNKAAIAANLAITPLPGGAGTAAVNAMKLGASTERAGKTKLVQWVNKKFVSTPMKKQFEAGRAGKKFKKLQSNVSSVLMNPFTEEANRLAHKAGTKVPSVKRR